MGGVSCDAPVYIYLHVLTRYLKVSRTQLHFWWESFPWPRDNKSDSNLRQIVLGKGFGGQKFWSSDKRLGNIYSSVHKSQTVRYRRLTTIRHWQEIIYGECSCTIRLTWSDLKRSKSRSRRFWRPASRKRAELGYMLLLNPNRKSYMGSPTAPSNLTLTERYM